MTTAVLATTKKDVDAVNETKFVEKNLSLQPSYTAGAIFYTEEYGYVKLT